eukprot:3239339-Pyramimonas_sp.AAC.1
MPGWTQLTGQTTSSCTGGAGDGARASARHQSASPPSQGGRRAKWSRTTKVRKARNAPATPCMRRKLWSPDDY